MGSSGLRYLRSGKPISLVNSGRLIRAAGLAKLVHAVARECDFLSRVDAAFFAHDAKLLNGCLDADDTRQQCRPTPIRRFHDDAKPSGVEFGGHR